MKGPLFSESIPLNRYSDIQIRSNILSPWQMTMTVTDRSNVVVVDINEEDLRKLAITAKMAIAALQLEKED